MKIFRTFVRWVCWLAFIALCLLTLVKMSLWAYYFTHPEYKSVLLVSVAMVLHLLPLLLFIWINRRVERHRLAWAGMLFGWLMLLVPEMMMEQGPLFSEVIAIQAGMIALPFMLTLVHRNESFGLE